MDHYAIIKNMVHEAEKHADNMSKDRLRAMQYEQGEMKDTPADEGRSQLVSRDVRANIKKVLPSLARTLLHGDELGEFHPVEQGDEEASKQSTDYLNYIIVPETNARTILYDALYDALLLRNGIVKWWWEEKTDATSSRHSGLSEEAFVELASDDEVEVLEHTERQEQIDGEMGPQEITVHDAKIKRMRTKRAARLAAVPRERFLIHPDATCLEDSLLTGEKDTITRSDLVAMGHDRKKVDDLPLAEEDEVEEDQRRDTVDGHNEAQRANEPIDYYDFYIRIDMDGDGIAELHHMQFAGGLGEKNMLVDEECEEVQFADISIMRRPHQWEGISLADDLMEIQRVKTVLLRSTADNIYWQNNPQPIFQRGRIHNPDALYNPEFGKPIEVKDGVSVKDAVGFNQVPFVASNSFEMMNYMDKEAEERTGVSDASSGLAPDALQNMTAKASAMIEAQGIGQTELMVKTAAEGIRRVFRGLLRLTIQHQDIPRTVRLRDEWVEVDPRQWNAEMDCSVNTGLGAGTRERDAQMMQAVMALQEKMLAAFGPNNPFVKPNNLSASTKKFVESVGLKTPSLYFTEPDPQEVQAQIDASEKAPSPEEMKLQAQMQLEQMKMQTNAAKEKAQMDADLQVKQAEIEAASRGQADKLASDAALLERKLQFDAQKWADEKQLRIEEMRQKREDEIMKFQASSMSKTLEGDTNAV